MKKFGIVIAVIGAIGLAAALIVGIFVSGAGLRDGLNETQYDINGGSGQVQLEAETEYRLFRTGEAPRNTSCEVTSPGGEVMEQSSSGISLTIENTEGAWYSMSKFTTQEAGEYDFDCTGDAMVRTADSADAIGKGIFGVLGSIFGAIGAGTLLIAGIILAVVGNYHEKQARRREQAAYRSPQQGM